MKHMAEVGIRALKQNASAVVAMAVAGEAVTITARGRPVAQLTAIPSSTVERRLVAGSARAPRRDIRELPAPVHGPSLSEVLAAMRSDERY